MEDPEWRKVCGALNELVSRDAAPVAAAPRLRGRGLWMGLAAAGLAVALGAGAWLARDHLPWAPRPVGSRVAILPFRVESQAPAARNFAASLSDQIQNSLNDNQIEVVSRDDAEALMGADRERRIRQMGVRLIFDGVVQDDGEATEVTVHLNEPAHHVTLWSSHFSGASDRPAELQAEIGGRIGAVLTCSSRALNPRDGLTDPEVLSQYLLACDLFARSGEDDPQMTFKMLGALRQVIQRAPRFPPAHAALAKFLAYSAAVLPAEQANASRKEARGEADKAIALDPKNADAYVALELLEPANHWSQREALLRKGLVGEPDFPHANGFLGQVLAEVGRLNEAAAYGQKAAAQNTLGETWAPPSAMFLIAAGQIAQADAVLTQLEKTGQDSVDVWNYRLHARIIEARWDAALAVLAEPIAARAMSPAAIERQRAFLQTVRAPTPAAVARQRTVQMEYAATSRRALSVAISNLSSLGLLDDAFKLAETYEPGQALTGGNSEFMFSPPTAPMRRDPRFLQLAARIGLVDYWRKTGKWPDFCRDPTLPYKCQ